MRFLSYLSFWYWYRALILVTTALHSCQILVLPVVLASHQPDLNVHPHDAQAILKAPLKEMVDPMTANTDITSESTVKFDWAVEASVDWHVRY
jgi:hypothetical protein